MTQRKREPQFYQGQEVTVGRYGAKLYVLSCREGQVTCVDLETGLQRTYSAHELYRL